MEWEKIDISNLPKGEVLAANFSKVSYGYKEKIIGYLHIDDDGVLCCDDDNTSLENCTHYIEISKYDIK